MKYVSTFVAAAVVITACSSAEKTSTSSPDGGSHSDAGAGPSTSVTGSAALTFTPKFAGYLTASGGCVVCSGPSPGPSGPAHYDTALVLLTDDPDVATHCAADGAVHLFDFTTYHYLSFSISIAGTQALTAGTYTTTNVTLPVNATNGETAVEISESCPTGSACANEGDVFQGSIIIKSVGSSITGTFDATEAAEGGTLKLSGSFDAVSCPQMPAGNPVPCLGCAAG